MKLQEVIYIDSYIKIFLSKTGKEKICPDLTQYAVINYSLGLIGNHGNRVKETIKINRKNIEFKGNRISISFYLDGLHNPYDCEITFHSLTIFLDNGIRPRLEIGKAYQFRNIKTEIPETLKEPKVRKKSKSKQQI